MPKGSITPHQPKSDIRSEGMILRVGNEDLSPQGALALARKVVAETLRGKWEVEPLSPGTREFAVDKPSGGRSPSVAQAWDYAAALEAHRDVVDAEPALVVPGFDPEPEQVFPPGTPQAKGVGGGKDLACSEPHEWNLEFCKVKEAWKVALPSHGKGKRFGEGILVGHPDTGYTEHPEIFHDGRIRADLGYDFENDDPNSIDPLKGKSPSHGTSTGSVLMSAEGAAPGGPGADFVTGAAPKAELVPIRVSTAVVHYSFKKVTKAIYHAVDQGCHVISMSLGGPVSADYLKRAVRYAVSKGVIPIAAAGNVWPWVVYPAHLKEVVAIAATNCQGKIWKKSATGGSVDVSAPGESVWRARTEEDGSFVVQRSNGTSYATALTAGVCALWLAHHGRDRLISRYGESRLASVFKEVLMSSGVQVPPNWNTQKHGAGILDAEALLRAPLPATAPAGGMAAITASPQPKSVSRFDELMELFPGQDRAGVRKAVAGLLKSKPDELGGELVGFGDELIYHLATNPTLRSRVALKASGSKSKKASPKAMREDPLLAKTASKRLKAKIQG